jgi:hypothetical protein
MIIKSHADAYTLAEGIFSALREGEILKINFINLRKEGIHFVVSGQSHREGREGVYMSSELADFVLYPERKRVNDALRSNVELFATLLSRVPAELAPEAPEAPAELAIELTEEAAEEYARLECIGEYHLWLTGLDGAAGVAYAELTAEEGARLRYLGGAHRDWPEDITPSSYYENAAEELNIYARRAGYANARAASAALRPAYEARQQAIADARIDAAIGRREAAKKSAATRRRNREAMARTNRVMREAAEAAIAGVGAYVTNAVNGSMNGHTAPALEPTPAPAPAAAEPTINAVNISSHGRVDTPAPGSAVWELKYNYCYEGATFNEAFSRVVLAQLRLSRISEAAMSGIFDADHRLTDLLIGLWDYRLAVATGLYKGVDYDLARINAALHIRETLPALYSEVYNAVIRGQRPMSILLWYAYSSYAEKIGAGAVCLLIDHCIRD